jgi:hypothetical protein
MPPCPPGSRLGGRKGAIYTRRVEDGFRQFWRDLEIHQRDAGLTSHRLRCKLAETRETGFDADGFKHRFQLPAYFQQPRWFGRLPRLSLNRIVCRPVKPL